MRRGDLVVAALPGDYGKPRPAVVVQSDALQDVASVLLCPLTSDVDRQISIRVGVEPTPGNGLTRPSQIMVDKLASIRRERCSEPIGRLDAETLALVSERLAFLLGLADA